MWQIDPTIQTQCGHEAVSSEEASMSGGNDEECPLDSPTMEMMKAEMVRSQEKPSNLLLTTINDPDLAKVPLRGWSIYDVTIVLIYFMVFKSLK